jgi:hypothetical protein
MSKGIYRFAVRYGRMGDLAAIFTAESEDVEKLIGKEVHFGEVLGKHSDVSLEMDDRYLRLITDNPDDVAMFERLELECGHNPFDYYEEQEDDEEE